MFLLSGTHATEKKLGHVAEFCHNCQAIKPFQVSRVGLGDHLYFVPFGTAKILGHHATCQACHIRMDVNALCYKDFAKQPGNDLDSLIRDTFPTVREIHAGRLALAQMLLDGKLKSSEREVMLQEAWRRFAVHTEQVCGKGIELGGKGGWGCLITFGIVFALVISTLWLPAIQNPHMFLAIGIVLAIGTIYSLIQLALNPGRVSKGLMSELATSLKPFAPSREELADYLDRLKRAGFKLGKKAKPDDLLAAMETRDVLRGNLRNW